MLPSALYARTGFPEGDRTFDHLSLFDLARAYSDIAPQCLEPLVANMILFL